MKNHLTEGISIEQVNVKRVIKGNIIETIDELAVEEPLEIQLIYGNNDNRIHKKISVTMRTPGNDKELAAGFLYTEGFIQNRNQIYEIISDSNKENVVSVTLCEGVMPVLKNSDRNFYMTSSCGVCGKSDIEAIRSDSVYENISCNTIVKSEIFFGLTDELRKQQRVFEITGGLHASALFEPDGNFIMLREDVGRHNALDKVIGAEFLCDHLPLTDKILLLSGRVSFELIQKAAMAGIKIVAAVGAPSSLTVQHAIKNDMTLIGFLKNERFNIYSGESKIM